MHTEEKHIRSIVKGLSWRAVGTLDTILISYIITGKITMALSIGGIELFSKILLYYAHERAWLKVSWGLKKEPQTFTGQAYIEDLETKSTYQPGSPF